MSASVHLDELLPAAEYMAVVETLEEEIAACERIAEDDGEEPERGELLRSAMSKIAPERDLTEER